MESPDSFIFQRRRKKSESFNGPLPQISQFDRKRQNSDMTSSAYDRLDTSGTSGGIGGFNQIPMFNYAPINVPTL
jgi:hypothetical protein